MNTLHITRSLPRQLLAATLVALASSAALADDPTIDTTPFVSTLTRNEVKAEVRQALRDHTLVATGESYGYSVNAPVSGLARSAVKAEVLAARNRGELQPAGEFDVASLPSARGTHGRTLSVTTLAAAR